MKSWPLCPLVRVVVLPFHLLEITSSLYMNLMHSMAMAASLVVIFKRSRGKRFLVQRPSRMPA